MDFYDRRILTVARDGRPRPFQQLLSEVGFSHNTLRQHLDQLVNQGIVERLKTPRRGPGRPLFSYRLSGGVSERAVSAFSNPSLGLVAVSFDDLSRVCKRERRAASARRSEVSVPLFRAHWSKNRHKNHF